MEWWACYVPNACRVLYVVITLELCEIHIGGVGFLCGVNEGMQSQI